MSWMGRVLDWLRQLGKPEARRHRLIRARCEGCGKQVAVIASTGRLWKHRCTREWHDGGAA
jgi:hypothetical protein